VPLTIFDAKGLPAIRRERIEAAIVAGGRHLTTSYAAWITVDLYRRVVRVLITGPQGFERVLQFSLDAEGYEITEQVRATLEEP